MSSYNMEQLESLGKVREYLAGISPDQRRLIIDQIDNYLKFRADVSDFLNEHFASVCNRKCFESRLSACCSKEGIITFFADVVVNALVSGEAELERLETVLSVPNTGFK